MPNAKGELMMEHKANNALDMCANVGVYENKKYIGNYSCGI